MRTSNPLSDIKAGYADHDLFLPLQVSKLYAYIALMAINSTSQAQGLEAQSRDRLCPKAGGVMKGREHHLHLGAVVQVVPAIFIAER